MTDAAPEGFPTPDGLASIMLMTFLCTFFIVLYLVNSRYVALTKATWNLVSTAFSIFIAILLYNAGADLFKVIAGYEDADDDDDDEPPGTKKTMIRLIQMIAWWFLIVFKLYFSSGSVLHTKTYGLLSGHILGFAGINFFGDICLDDPFRDNPWWCLVVMAILLFTFGVLFAISIGIAKCLKSTLTDEAADLWHDQSNDTGNDFLNMSGGFVMSMFFRYLVSGQVPSLDGQMGFSGGWQQIGLMAIGFALLVFTVVLALGHAKAPEGSWKENMYSMINGMLTNTAAFCILFGFMWTVQTKSEIIGHCIVAIFCSLAAIFYIFVAGYVFHQYEVKPRVLRAPFTAIALVVALSWEKLFDAMMDKMTTSIEVRGITDSRLITLLWILLMVLIIFPAWAVYIYPKTDDEVQKAYSRELVKGPLPVRAVCCDADLLNDDDASDEDEDSEAAPFCCGA